MMMRGSLQQAARTASQHRACSSTMLHTKAPQPVYENSSSAASYGKKMQEVALRIAKREERVRAKRENYLVDAQTGLPTFLDSVTESGQEALLHRVETKTIQVNIGLLCNQACHHCHVESSPLRVTENMNEAAVDRVLALIKECRTIETLDITGGAPELNPYFRKLAKGARAEGIKVIDRCNLTVLSLKGHEDTPAFLAEHGIEVVASMPCYSTENVDAQRGEGVFDASIEGLQKLNAAGYGKPGTGLTLNLVYNPLGPFLPPQQKALEAAYKEKLLETFDIHFNELFTITNLPVKRFADDLRKEDKLAEYMKLLVENFNPATIEGLMCRDTISISWNGSLYDCDFNQQLGLNMSPPVEGGAAAAAAAAAAAGDAEEEFAPSIWNIESFNSFLTNQIKLGPHCYGCTAGAGSSCGGALS